MKPKVFCIGFHKTGTTSLAIALRLLGYRVTGPNGTKDADIAEKVYDMAYSLVEQFDAFQDNPWPVLYRELDQKYPGSKFILTRRSADAWIRSQVKDFGLSETPMRKWIYGVGCPEGNEDVFVARYEKHNLEVLLHFSNRRQDLLVIDLPDGAGWERLCPFLGVDIPDTPFPHANKASLSRKMKNFFSHLVKGR